MKRDRTRPRPAALTAKEAARRDRLRQAALKWCVMPPGMSSKLAGRFEKLVRSGKTIRELTGTPQSKTFLVPNSRFKKHCELNPAWGERILTLGKAADSKKKKRRNIGYALATKKMCLKGLHRMTRDNVLVDGVGHRRCRACRYISMPGNPMTSETVERIKDAIINGASFSQICHGRPIGGGAVDHSLSITTAAKFQRQRELDPEFDAFVNKHFASSNSIGQILRHNPDLPPELKPTVIAVARLKHKIKAICRSRNRGCAQSNGRDD